MNALDARALLEAADAQREALRATVEAEGEPRLRAAWSASPGRIVEGSLLGRQFMRVGLVERRTWAAGVFDLVWLEVLVYRPFADQPMLLLEDVRLNVDGVKRPWWRLTLSPSFPGDYAFHADEGQGVFVYREVGRPCERGAYLGPWVHCGINQRPDQRDEGRVDHMKPEGDVEAVVYPAACAWMEANGGPHVR